MPKWTEYKEAARSRGALALELYVVMSTPDGAPELLREVLPEHLAYQQRVEAEGRLVFAGPLSDESGEEMQGAGLIVYRAESLNAARALAEADPMHARGARTFSLRRWLINEGSLDFGIRLSQQSVRFT